MDGPNFSKEALIAKQGTTELQVQQGRLIGGRIAGAFVEGGSEVRTRLITVVNPMCKPKKNITIKTSSS